MLSDGFGVREFQLVLLRRMADYQPTLVDDARESLGVTRTGMREANAHWQRLVRSGHFPDRMRRYRLVLGDPDAEGEHRVADLSCRVGRWRLPLWPDLRFEVLAAPGGTVLNAWLVRDPSTPPPRLHRLDDLGPWSCVVADVEEAFAPVVHGEGSAPTRWTTAFTGPDGTGRPTRVVGHFVYGLLQAVEPAPVSGV